MSQLFQKYSHLNRYKITRGLRVHTEGSGTCEYLAERKLKKILKDNLTEEIYHLFKDQKKYKPKWMNSFGNFRDKIVQHIELDKKVSEKLDLFYNTDLITVIDKYINKRKRK